jgi:hypothetical protein
MSRESEAGHLDDEALILHYFGEDGRAERESARRHLASCEACRDELQQIRETLELVAEAGAPAAPEGFERVMWARVSAGLATPPGAGWRAWFTVPRLAFAGGLLALVVAAFVAGRWSRPPAASAPSELMATLSPESVRRLATEDHLERAQMVLVEVLHSDAGDPDLEGERGRAADLVAANRLIRQSTTTGTADATADVLDDLERVLVEFVNRADGWSADELEAFKARLDAGGILFRLRVVSAEMRQRAERRAPPVT